MALALTQTHGKVISVEINPIIAESARENFRNSGLSDVIELRVGDVREQLPRMKMTFDLIFVDIGSDAAQNVFPSFRAKISRGGAIAVHDVLVNGAERPYVAFVRKQPAMRTTVTAHSPEGLAISTRIR
jgi:predicted O-methyltransferase YrrM